MENIDDATKKTILIVDDEPPIVDILVYNLQKEMYWDSVDVFWMIQNRNILTRATHRYITRKITCTGLI